MRKLIVILIVAAIALQFYRAHGPETHGRIPTVHELLGGAATPQPKQKPAGFLCDGRRYCIEMTSREEAENFLAFCPNTELDANNNGIPCEDHNRF